VTHARNCGNENARDAVCPAKTREEGRLGQMSEFLGILATFGFGLGATAALAVCMEQRQLASSHVDEGADVRGDFITVTDSGYALAPQTMPVQLGFREGQI
jgi:hypothetical protein